MSSNGTVGLKDIWAMLDDCAPGHDRRETNHYWRITYGPEVFPTLPKGPHGARTNPPIQVGVIKQMARQLGILDCAKRFLQQLR